MTERYRVDPPTDMVRMVVDRASFRPVLGDAVRLDVGETRSTSTASTSWG